VLRQGLDSTTIETLSVVDEIVLVHAFETRRILMKSVFTQHMYTGHDTREDVCLNFSDTSVAGISKKAGGNVIGRYPTVTPAFVDPHSHIGLVRSGEPEQEAEGNEKMASMMVLSDALDALQMDDSAFQDAIEMGVLYSCIMPGSGNIIGGRSAVIRHFAEHSSQALVARAGIKAAFGYNPTSTLEWKGDRPSTRMGAVGMLREKLADVSQKLDRYRTATSRKNRKSHSARRRNGFGPFSKAVSGCGSMSTKSTILRRC